MKGACESRPRASVGQLGTGTSDPSPMLLCGISQCFQNMRSLVGCISGKEGRLGGGGGRKWCLARSCSCILRLPLHSHPSQVWPVLPLQCPDCDPGRGCEKAPTPTHLSSGLKYSRVTREGGDEAWQHLRMLSCPLPGWWPESPHLFCGTRMTCPIAQACRAHGSEPNFHSGKTWLIQECSWQV